MVGAAAQSSDARMKMKSAQNISRRRPRASPSVPYIGAAMVDAIRYDTTIHDARSTLPVSAAIAGNAVATMV